MDQGRIQGTLNQVNGRLKSAKVGVRVEIAGGKLRLRATLPPKPTSKKTTPYQQRICPDLPANLAGLREAEKKARLLGAQIAAREFNWAEWADTPTPTALACGEWIDRFREDYLGNGGTLTTWNGDYWKILKRLPPDAEIDPALLESLAAGTAPNSRSRARAVMALSALARFAGVGCDLAGLRGNYGAGKTSRRELPEDVLIAEIFHSLKNPGWRWVYGVMACYGLRNHEAFHLDLSQFPIIEVGERTKTGARQVFPCYPEWADEWELQNRVLPPIDLNRDNEAIGHSVTSYLSPLLPFKPYDLRHAWAVRTLEFGFPIELAAMQMGHSVAVHQKTYHRWITSKHYQRIYSILMERGDRPRAPKL